MFILENTDTFQEEFNNFPEITDWSNDSYNILEASLFFEEDISNIITEMAVSEVNAYHEGTIESFNEGAFETVKNKIKQLWAKFKALVERKFMIVLWHGFVKYLCLMILSGVNMEM